MLLTTFYPCRPEAEHQMLHAPLGGSETGGESDPIYEDGELVELTQGANGRFHPTNLHDRQRAP
jgi:hypothetical protein